MLILYTRTECCLCEEARALLNGLGCRYDTVFIDEDLALIRRYGDRIPVVVDPGSQTEWAWPFTAEDLKHAI